MKTRNGPGSTSPDTPTIPDDEVLNEPSQPSESANTDSGDSHTDFDIFDVRGFIRAVVEEGRDLPSEAAIIKLEQAFSVKPRRVTLSDNDVDAQEDVDEDFGEKEKYDGGEEEGEDRNIQTFIMTRDRIEELLGRRGSIQKHSYLEPHQSFVGHNCIVVHP
ncbi:hypothetical protein OBBRIDRAFT_441932 [Obba rivulosa]|uniref:Uncharacterized protein n=1 Tax=Obba rivulosa TaxID=1052685 RepID=A0A8E2DUG0_9APHY|nr:hypothetical protein OBBRIDRAFT_441932 [Obba rivulosa]